MIEEVPNQWEPIPNIKTLIDNEFTVPKMVDRSIKTYAKHAKRCSVDTCGRFASKTDNDLCAQHEREMLIAADQWELGKIKARQYTCAHDEINDFEMCSMCGMSMQEYNAEKFEDMVDRRVDDEKL